MVANRLRRRLPVGEWAITIVDQDPDHHYQPGYLLIPFGVYDPSMVVRPRKRFLPRGVNTIVGEIDLVEPESNRVRTAHGTFLQYDP